MRDDDRADGDSDRADGDGDRADGDGDEADPFADEVFGDEPRGESGDRFEESDADGVDELDAGEADDPFATLGEGVDDGVEAAPRADPVPDAAAAPEPGSPGDDPFAELDDDAVDSPTDEDLFESMGSGDVGEEDVWEALDEGASIGADATELGGVTEGNSVGGAGAPGTGVAGPSSGPGRGVDERVVDKRSYCQRCPHFAAPPETACSHEGTVIVESVDFSRFRVRNCPMVDADDPTFDGE